MALPRDREGLYVASRALILTVGLPMGTQAETNHHAAAAIRALRRAGYRADQTSDESIRALADQLSLVDGIVRARTVLDTEEDENDAAE